MGHRALLPLLLAALSLLSGCESLRLYSDVRDKQGKAAKEAWTAVDLSALIATERTNLKNLLDAELATQDNLAMGIRNHELRYLVDAPKLKVGLVDQVETRLTKVAGSGANVQSSRDRLRKFRTSTARFDVFREEFKAKGLALPTCKSVANKQVPSDIERWLTTADKLDAGEIELTLTKVRSECDKSESDITVAVYKGIGGEVATALQQYEDDATALKAAEAKANALKVTYQKAVRDYEAAVNAAVAEPQAAGKVTKALEDLQKALGKLGDAQDAFSVQFLSKERLDWLNKFVDVVTQADGSVPAGAGKAATAFILLPGLADDVKASLADAKKPLTLPLLIRRNHDQLTLEAATRDIAVRRARVAISLELVATLYDQAVQLWLASGELGDPSVVELYAKTPVDAFASAKPNQKESLYMAASRYLDAVGRLSAKRYRLEYMRVATFHEVSLVYSEVNMKQWQSLISATVDQVAASAASGIKPETVSALLNTLGVLWIGYGVNK